MSRPSIKDRARDPICPNCGAAVERKSKFGPPPTYCNGNCRLELHRRLAREGAAIAAYAKGWRIDRGSGEIASNSFSELCHLIDRFNAADRRAERPRADLLAAKMLDDPRRYVDRKRG